MRLRQKIIGLVALAVSAVLLQLSGCASSQMRSGSTNCLPTFQLLNGKTLAQQSDALRALPSARRLEAALCGANGFHPPIMHLLYEFVMEDKNAPEIVINRLIHGAAEHEVKDIVLAIEWLNIYRKLTTSQCLTAKMEINAQSKYTRDNELSISLQRTASALRSCYSFKQ